MATVLEECNTEVGSVYRVKGFTTGSRNSLKDVRKSQTMPDQEWKWLRQQSKDKEKFRQIY
jgi:hypothetical protein